MPSTEQVAWIRTPETLFFARCRKSAPAPTSAVIKLLQGIFDLHRDHSFFILRNRIGLSYEPEPQDLGMIKLLAKRHSVGTPPPDLATGTEIGKPDEPFYAIQSRRFLIAHEPGIVIKDYKSTLTAMESQIPLADVPHDSPRKIVAYALDDRDRLLAAAAHSGVVNKSLHAEVCLIQDLHRAGLARFPSGGKLFVSMKPCRMCAAMIMDFLPADFSGKILYRDENDGSSTRGSVLEGRKYFGAL